MTSTETRAPDHGYWAALVAAGIPVAPPRSWFDQDQCPDGSPFTITTEGQVFGKVAPRDIDHVGLPGRGVRAPYSRCGHGYFHTGQTRCADGSLVSTGPITMLTGHADLDDDSLNAASHYDHNGTAVADIVAFDRPDGVYCVGAARPGVSPEQVRMAMGSIPSGDWRWINADDFKGQEMVACLLVNHGGFPTRRDDYALAASLGWDTKSSDLVLDWDNPPRIITAASGASTPTQEPPMSEQSHPEPTTPESLVAASPFGKGEPAPEPDDDGDGGSFGEGESALISGTNIVVQITGEAEDGALAFEGVLPADALEAADEAVAASAARRFTDGMQDRARDSRLDKLTSAIESLAASAAEDREARRSADAKLDEVLAKQRADEAERLIASAGLEA